MKQKLETGAMLNPKCQECTKRDSCNNKTLCAYLILPIEIKNPQKELSIPLKLTPKMIQKEIIKKACEINVGINNASLMTLRK